ncbi:MAG TPA: aminoglycoside phosphotransferase family protein [Kouleothrix sp.]|uniref:phosphotransferase family protein n=1 Tax=Kouleothrix sp. TaxID=2779161 RepID=UPI002B523781|nr:aminoglycoside phosphotransferase family protein [Kouleothrix sp.]
MSDDQKNANQPSGDSLRETGVVRVMTSTSIHKHPTAFINTRLPVLEVALDTEKMTKHFEPLLAVLARPGQSPAVKYAKLLAYKQGNRGLIHYEITGTQYGDTCVVYGKLYPELVQAERTCQTMQSLHDDCFRSSPALGVPRALGCIPDMSMLVYVPADGEMLGDVFGADNALRYVDMAGEWLGMLHSFPLKIEKHFRLATELVNVQAWAVLVGHKYPEFADDAMRIAKHLQDHASEMAFETQSPIHKDFHYGHILVDKGLKVIDFDEMRLGDPNFDLAHFCANLHLLAYRVKNSPYQFSTLQSAFLRAYARVTDWEPNERFVYFYAYTCLKIMKQLCSMRGLRPRPEGDEQRKQVQLMLEQGLGALPNATRQKLSSKFATMIMNDERK